MRTLFLPCLFLLFGCGTVQTVELPPKKPNHLLELTSAVDDFVLYEQMIVDSIQARYVVRVNAQTRQLQQNDQIFTRDCLGQRIDRRCEKLRTDQQRLLARITTDTINFIEKTVRAHERSVPLLARIFRQTRTIVRKMHLSELTIVETQLMRALNALQVQTSSREPMILLDLIRLAMVKREENVKKWPSDREELLRTRDLILRGIIPDSIQTPRRQMTPKQDTTTYL